MFLRRSDRLDDAHFRPIDASTLAPRADDTPACQDWAAAAAAAAALSLSSVSLSPLSPLAAIALDSATSNAGDAVGSGGCTDHTVGAAFNAWIAQFRVACVRDYYATWRANDGAPTTGKLVFIHTSAYENCELHVFFDDYIARNAQDHQCIVDARCARTGDPLPLSYTLGKHLVRVSTMDAVLDQHYLIRAFQDAVSC